MSTYIFIVSATNYPVLPITALSTFQSMGKQFLFSTIFLGTYLFVSELISLTKQQIKPGKHYNAKSIHIHKYWCSWYFLGQ